uniref:TSA: Wollemia nobilis Ref_Wollemi_Transcript_10877_2666 transcribed RNA sequence n=1 Tax=Wollemia nobilis TaxID=56998 RepID=A0A0C9S8L9_9CONI
MASPNRIAASLAVGNLLQGWDTSAIAGAMLYIKPEFHLDNKPALLGMIVTISVLGGLCTSLIAGVFADKFGRRKILVMAASLYFLSSCATSLSPNVNFLLAARFLVGCAYGLSGTVVPLLISETSPSNIRGRLTAFTQLTNSAGQFMAYFMVFMISLQNAASWRLMTATLTVPALVYIALGLLYLPESPRWLVSKGRMQEAKQVLQRLLGKEDVTDDLALVVEGLGSGKSATIEEYVVEPADKSSENITGSDKQKIHLYGLQESWVAKSTSHVEPAQITSYSFMDPTVAVMESFQHVPHYEHIDQNDEAHEGAQWDLENQADANEEHSDEDEDETASHLDESIPNTPMLEHDWGFGRSNSTHHDSLKAPLLSQNNSGYTDRRTVNKGKVSVDFLNNFHSAGNMKFSPKSGGHVNNSMTGSFSASGEQGMRLGGDWQVAWQWDKPNEANQSGSLKRMFIFPGSVSQAPSAVGSMRSLPGLEGREPLHVAALVGESALCATQDNCEPSLSEAGVVCGPAVVHPSQFSKQGVSLSDFSDIRVKRALTVGMTLQFLQQFCGISAVLFFTPQILEQAGVENLLVELGIKAESAALLASSLTSLPMLIFVVWGMVLMDQAGRRKILLYTTPILFVTMVVIAFVKLLLYPGQLQGFILIGSIMVFFCIFNMGFGAIPNIVCSEIFPTKVSGACLGICGVTMWLSTMVVTLSFPVLKNVVGDPAVFGFFGVMCLVSWIFTFFKVPETKGLPLEVIAEFFALKKGKAD